MEPWASLRARASLWLHRASRSACSAASGSSTRSPRRVPPAAPSSSRGFKKKWRAAAPIHPMPAGPAPHVPPSSTSRAGGAVHSVRRKMLLVLASLCVLATVYSHSRQPYMSYIPGHTRQRCISFYTLYSIIKDRDTYYIGSDKRHRAHAIEATESYKTVIQVIEGMS